MNLLVSLFGAEEVAETWQVLKGEIPLAIWQTIYVTLISTAFSILIGLPLGVILVTGEKTASDRCRRR